MVGPQLPCGFIPSSHPATGEGTLGVPCAAALEGAQDCSPFAGPISSLPREIRCPQTDTSPSKTQGWGREQRQPRRGKHHPFGTGIMQQGQILQRMLAP